MIIVYCSYDHKVDMWALGCVVYELLTLKKTFQATVSKTKQHSIEWLCTCIHSLSYGADKNIFKLFGFYNLKYRYELVIV